MRNKYYLSDIINMRISMNKDVQNEILKLAHKLFYDDEEYDFNIEIKKIFDYSKKTLNEQKLYDIAINEKLSIKYLADLITKDHIERIEQTKKSNNDAMINKFIESNDFKSIEELLKKINVSSNIRQNVIQKKNEFIQEIKHKFISENIDIQAFIDKLPDNDCFEFLDFVDAVNELDTILKKYDFLQADSIYKNNSFIDKTSYCNLKAKYTKEYFDKVHKIKINDEQAYAISEPTQNLIVTVRAGSGKTRTIACKTIMAIEKENIKPDEILLLSFNCNASEEMRKRICEDFKYNNFDKKTARTFHSLAWDVIQPTQKLIYDDGEKEVRQKLTEFIYNIYSSKKVFTDEFKNDLYDFLRWSPDKYDYIESKYWVFRDDYEKYTALRSKKQITLNREKVKSNGEKWIADFLFEHDINYRYEDILACEGIDRKNKRTVKERKLYHPDFTIWDKETERQYIIEHWGIDENDPDRKVPKKWIKSWEKYYEEMQWKREVFLFKSMQKDMVLIETSVADMRNGRKCFEDILKTRLEKAGLKCKKLSIDEILAKIDDNYVDSMAKKFANFILFAQKSEVSSDEIDKKLANNIFNGNRRCELFVKMANTIYKRYKIELVAQNKIDFDNVLVKTTNKIIDSKGNCKISFSDKTQEIKNIKMILIDEYQDFSKLFFDIIKAIQQFNPEVKIFCVGDDWQAINSFAGSDLYFFKEFKNLFKNSDSANLTHNYRSAKSVVYAGNSLMAGFGVPSKFISKVEGKIELRYIDDVDIRPYIEKGFVGIHSRYFIECMNIISKDPKKSYFIMHRESTIANYSELKNFESAFSAWCKKKNLRVNFMVDTIHKFKGMEADVVIILEATNNEFPLLHPDSEFNLVFGKTAQMQLDEERRLFYVALTRAKTDIYILTERSNISDYILKIQNYIKK